MLQYFENIKYMLLLLHHLMIICSIFVFTNQLIETAWLELWELQTCLLCQWKGYEHVDPIGSLM